MREIEERQRQKGETGGESKEERQRAEVEWSNRGEK